jgi:ribosomal protein L3
MTVIAVTVISFTPVIVHAFEFSDKNLKYELVYDMISVLVPVDN